MDKYLIVAVAMSFVAVFSMSYLFVDKVINDMRDWKVRQYESGNTGVLSIMWHNIRYGRVFDIPFWLWPILVVLMVAGVYVFKNPVTAGLCALACALVPSSIFRTIANHHKEDEISSLPSAIIIISGEYASHGSIPKAIKAVGETVPGAVGKVFTESYKEYTATSNLRKALSIIEKRMNTTYAIQLADLLRELQTEGDKIIPLLNDLADDVTDVQRLLLKQKSEVSNERWFTAFITFLPILTFFGLQYFLPETATYIMATFMGRVIVTLVMGSIVIWFMIDKFVLDENY